jgi:hypothetical protein
MSKAKGNVDLLMYRLDLLEKRLENIELMLHKPNNNGPSSEILHILLDMIKQQQHTQLLPNQAVMQHNNNVPACPPAKDNDAKVEHTPGDSFDSITCIGRRRTVV